MAEMAASSAELALENQRLGPLQIRVAALCTLVQICDGYDINSIGVAVPQLTHLWNLPGPAFTTAFLWSSIGIMVGALSAGPIGDRVGRKPLLLASLTIFGLASIASGLVGSLGALAVTRFFTGIGIGAAFPGAASLTGDYAPHRRRALMIMASFTGAPLGGFLCGQIAGVLLPRFGWESVFFVGGIVPLLMVVALAIWLPESPRFLARKANLSPREAAVLRELDITPEQITAVERPGGNPVAALFGQGYALQTVLLWIVFFCSLMNLFLFAYWLPEVLHLGGYTPAEAARASSYRDLGAIFAVFYLGMLIDKHGPERALALHYAAGILFIGAIALFVMPALLLAIMIFFAGMMITGSQTGANATAGKLYPARMRTSGIGWALGIGRLGGIAAPVLGGWLLTLGMRPPQIFLSACGFAFIAAVATALLAFRGEPAPVLTPQEAAE
ncbi:MAG TPA: MFS transporter [Stellaceae bacterium]|jgi:AAHS family 4-hydroxybenzoate transporter-like MFS transporter|nr:MFS transporter [Stellaceae bacterium]